MNDPKGFLSRWSRRKRAAAPKTSERPLPDDAIGDRRSETADAATPAESRPASDRDILPPIDSIGPESDIRAFLAAGVPADLTRAALRRVWSSDPTIRDFVGLSENSWDFNSATSMAGFGPIDEETVRRLVTRVLGETKSPAEATAETEQPAPPAGGCDSVDGIDAVAATTAGDAARDRRPTGRATSDTPEGDASSTLLQDDAARRERTMLPPKRRHGSALPE